MSLAVAVTAALGAAAAFGAASAAQHAAAHDQTGDGEVDVKGLARLPRDPRWLLGTVADVVGLLLQVLALDHGPVSVVQPVQVVGLLVALPVGAWLGGPAVTRRSVGPAVLLVVGLVGFLLLVGDPGRGHPPGRWASIAPALVMLVLTGLLLLGCRNSSATTRAVVYGLTSGALFALTAVLIRLLTLRLHRHGLATFAHAGGLVPLACVVVVGAVGLTVGQAGFQVGPLAASLPAQVAADPVAAVVLGRVLLGEGVSFAAGNVVGYVVALVAVVAGARVLALLEYPAASPG